MRFFYIFIITLAILIVLSWQAHAAPVIAYYYDGDTVKIKDGATTYRLRLSEIDAPERNQQYGKKSRRALMSFCQHATLKVVITGIDQYKRQIGQLYCNQQNAAEFMVGHGHAWFNDKYSNNQYLDALQKSARQNKTGLWFKDKAMPPWVWRKLNHTAYKRQ